MEMIFSVLNIMAPLLLITLGALVSEYTGRLAMFLEGIINAGAFFCYAFTLLTHSALAGTMLSVLVCMILIFGIERFATMQGANMFLLSLALNLLTASFITFFSAEFFGTRGVLYSEAFSFTPKTARLVTSLVCYAFCAIIILLLTFTRQGLTFKITGSDPDVLTAQGISVSFYRSAGWVTAAFCGALGGATLALRLSSFVPGMASGRGWTALAAVYLGKKHPLWSIAAVLVFALAEYAGSHIQNIQFFSAVPSSVLLALPYLLALVMIIVWNKK